jgi:hypothetical protein
VDLEEATKYYKYGIHHDINSVRRHNYIYSRIQNQYRYTGRALANIQSHPAVLELASPDPLLNRAQLSSLCWILWFSDSDENLVNQEPSLPLHIRSPQNRMAT